MAEPAATPAPNEAASEKSPSDFRVTLRLISPSRDLSNFPAFADLPVSTTVGQVKAQISNELAIRQRSTAGMRLIYRGRVLDVDDKTLLDVFGAAPIQESKIQILHLVLRESSSGSNGNATTNTSQPFQFNQPLQPPPVAPGGVPFGIPDRATAPGPARVMNVANPQTQTFYFHQQHPRQPLGPSPAAGLPNSIMMQHLDAHARAVLEIARQQNPALAQWMQPPNPITNNGENASQHVGSSQNPAPQADPSPAIDSATPGRSYSPSSRGGERQQRRELSTSDVERILTAVEARPVQTGHSGPGIPALHPQCSSGAQQGSTPLQRSDMSTASGVSWNRPSQQEPDVYILASPNGPRALLINGSTEAYYTPPVSGTTTRRTTYTTMSSPVAVNDQWHVNIVQHNDRGQQQQQHNLIRQHMQHVQMLQQLQQRHLQQHPQLQQHHQPAQQLHQQLGGQHGQDGPAGFMHQHIPVEQQQQLPNVHAVPPNRPPRLQPNNPGAGFLAAMWPHIWLIARLALFVWWFTAPTASWSRWAMVILLATAVFIGNTGVLDGFVNQAWAPIRRHLDGLLPLANANGNRVQNAQNGPNGQNAAGPAPQDNDNGGMVDNAEPVAAVPIGRAGGPEPDPAETAARLMARRRDANGDRLMNLARRLERVGIMFLASLAPGIAERHVALVEEEERAERRRRQEAEEAAAAAAAAAAEAAAAEGAVEGQENGEGVSNTSNEAPTPEDSRQQERQEPVAEPPAQPQEEPLIAF